MAKMKTDEQKDTGWEIPIKFKTWVDLYLNPDTTGSIVQTCKDAELSRSTLYNWLEHEEAVEYMNKRMAEIRKRHSPKIDSAVIRKAEKGDIAAARLYYEMFGDLKHKFQHSGEDFPKLVIEYGNGNGSQT